jgi:sec-independent protein translocase protein TatA
VVICGRRPDFLLEAARPCQEDRTVLTSILQPTHLIIVLIVALLILGPKRLPDAGRALGQGLKEFKNSISPDHDDDPQDQIPAATPSTPET